MRSSARPRETHRCFHGGCAGTAFIPNCGHTADGYCSVPRLEASSVQRVLTASSACPPFLDTPADPRRIPGLFLQFLSSPRLFSRSTGGAFWGRETATPL